jgi:simple sugar transport system permease protein
MAKSETAHEPLIRISKREGITRTQSGLIRLLSLLLALIVSGIVIVCIVRINPFKVYATMASGAFGTSKRIWVTIRDIMTLLCISVGLAPAFAMKFWNVGAEGQILVGGIATVVCMKYFTGLPTIVLVLIMIIMSMLAGAIWGFFPGFFKAHWNTNETLFTLMMNYIAIQLVSCMINVWVPTGSSVMGVVNQNTQIGWMPAMPFPDAWGLSPSAKNYFFNILTVLVLTVVMFVYLRYSKHGYEISVVGESVNTANYIGINVKKVIIRTLVFSGLLCGVSGFLLVSGTDHSITTGLDRGYGFTAIIVAWLAKFNPLMMILTSFLIVFLDKGASDIAMNMGFNESVGEIITGIIIFFIIGCEFFINYRIVKTHREG